MFDVALVVMAAGLGSRYGSLKQLEGVGPSGELLIEYSIYDALRAGFNRVVFVVQPGMEESMHFLCGERISKYVDVSYVAQSNASLPEFYCVPSGRCKPFGTVHALLSARTAVTGPFAVINADDFYGLDTYRCMFDAVCRLSPVGEACMPAYWLRNTLSPYGSVSRGICEVRYGKLTGIQERRNLMALPDGSIRNVHGPDVLSGAAICPNSLASMNFWGFTPWIFERAEDIFNRFLLSLGPDDIQSECILTDLIERLISNGELSVAVLPTDAQWFGVTYSADKKLAQESLRRLIAAGEYPERLFSS